METKDSRPTNYLDRPAVRRRRRCKKCHWAVTTYEVAETVLAQSDTRLARTMPRLRAMHEVVEQLISEYDGAHPEVVP